MAKRNAKSTSEKITPAKRIEKMVEKLRHDYDIGVKAQSAKKSLEKIARRNGLSIDTVRKLKLFSEQYTAEELDELCALRRKGSGLPLHFGYVIYLLAAQSAAERASLAAMQEPDGKGRIDREKARREGKRERTRLAKRTEEHDWTAPQLYAEIIQKFGRRKGHHGRSKVLPEDPRVASQLALGEITKWCNRLQELLRSRDDEHFPAPTRSDLRSQLDVVSRKIHKIKRLLK